MPPGPGLPGDLFAEVAEILEIDQQELEEAFAQVQSEPGKGSRFAFTVPVAEPDS